MKKYIEYVPIWSLQVSPRAILNISIMIDPEKEKSFFENEEYLKNLETKEEYEKESKKRIKIKKDEEKFYINSTITGYNQIPFRTKGSSIFRHQIPEMIKALQDIYGGKHDESIIELLLESGIIKRHTKADSE